MLDSFRRSRSLPLLATLVLMAGCSSMDLGPARVPVTATRYEWSSAVPNRDKTLLVFLPGRGTTGKDFDKEGFLSAVERAPVVEPGAASQTNGQEATSRVDAITVDLTFPYYEQRTAVQRLHDDIIAPARAAGYRRIWLVGCSVGGLGAFFYDHDHPGEISGIVAFGPYLGEKEVIAEIEAAGGLDRWQPRQPPADDDFQRRLWLGIRAARYGQPGHLPLVLACGTLDRFGHGQKLLAANVPADRVFMEYGFHDWGTWHHLWGKILRSPVSPLVTAEATR